MICLRCIVLIHLSIVHLVCSFIQLFVDSLSLSLALHRFIRGFVDVLFPLSSLARYGGCSFNSKLPAKIRKDSRVQGIDIPMSDYRSCGKPNNNLPIYMVGHILGMVYDWVNPKNGGFLSHRATPSHHPFRTMGFSHGNQPSSDKGVAPWPWKPSIDIDHWDTLINGIFH